jgi:hypothetical protein
MLQKFTGILFQVNLAVKQGIHICISTGNDKHQEYEKDKWKTELISPLIFGLGAYQH